MKKNIALIAVAAMLAVSCQNEITPEKDNSNNPVEGKLTATIVQTKVSYNETSEMNLQPAWEVGDEIIGFDDAGKTYTLTVASVEAETATLEGTVPDGNLHLIYKSGAQASDISSKTLAIDYTAQAGDKTMPAVMLADGTVTDGSCNFAFTNAGAIIGISAVNGVPSGSAISKITVEGENLSAATVALSGSALALTATENADDAISTATLGGITVTDVNGTLSSQIFVAVPAGAKIAKVSAIATKEVEAMKIPSTAADKEGVDYVTIGGLKWAKWNVGANSETDYGYYYAWAGTEGYVRYANTWQSAEATFVEFTYSPSSAKTAVASDYVYVNTQSFEVTGHIFNAENTPYHTGTSWVTGYSKYAQSSKSSYWSGVGSPDNKLVLDPEDDAASVNWGGTWRMPTREEYQALCSACGISSSYIILPSIASSNPSQGIYVLSAEQTYFPDYTGVAGVLFCDGINHLFFPLSGYGDENTYYPGSATYLWLSSLGTNPMVGGRMGLGSELSVQSSINRGFPLCVRPVSN